MRKVRVFSASVGKHFGETPENFGDNLMHHLLGELFQLEAEYVHCSKAELLGVGSVLDAYFRRKRGEPVKWFRKLPWRTMQVWGSGFMAADTRAIWPQSIKIQAVRGPLSRERLKETGVSPGDIALGDPALLLPQIWPAGPSKDCKVLIAPHFVTLDVFKKKYGDRLPRHWEILDLLKEPRSIASKIAGAEFVISSSLHGLIVADAYNVPSCWMAPHAAIKGDGFKFDDYAAQRGKRLGSAVDFDDVLAGKIDLEHDQYKPAPPQEAAMAKLLASFPFR